MTATYTLAGTYSLQATAKDTSGLTATSTVTVTVVQAYNSIIVAPLTPSVNYNANVQFAAVAEDQFNQPLASQPPFYWTISGAGAGFLTNSGLYTAGTTAGTFTVTVTNGRSGTTAATTVTDVSAANQPPTVATAATATPATVSATTSNLSVLGADAGGEPNLTYTWATKGNAPGPVTFRANGTNSAKNTTVTFAAAGTYTFQVTITNASGLATVSSVNVTVNPTLASIVVSPGSATVRNNATQQFTGSALDQFGNVFLPAITWSVDSGGAGHDQQHRLIHCLELGNGAGDGQSDQQRRQWHSQRHGSHQPAAHSGDACRCRPSPVTGTTTNLSVLGADDGGEANLTYAWATTGTPPAAVTFSSNSLNASKNTVATFTKAGLYNLQVTITDSAGLTTTSTVSVTVTQTLAAIAVTPSTANVVDGAASIQCFRKRPVRQSPCFPAGVHLVGNRSGLDQQHQRHVFGPRHRHGVERHPSDKWRRNGYCKRVDHRRHAPRPQHPAGRLWRRYFDPGWPEPAERPRHQQHGGAQAADALDPRDLSAFIYAWGQFVDHDLDLTPDGGTSDPIAVPAGDPQFDPAGPEHKHCRSPARSPIRPPAAARATRSTRCRW